MHERRYRPGEIESFLLILSSQRLLLVVELKLLFLFKYVFIKLNDYCTCSGCGQNY